VLSTTTSIAQVVSKTDSTEISSLENKDVTLPSDSTQTDSIAKKEPLLTDIVKYTAKDTIRSNVVTQEVFLYNNAEVNYGDINLKAGKIDIDWASNTMKATGIPDSTGAITQKPVFTQAGKVYETDTITYNFDSNKGLIKRVRTEEGEGYLTGNKIKKVNDDVIYVKNGYFTTDKKEHPDYYLWANKIKVIPGKEIITSYTQMYIADVPTPLILPFGYFPTTEHRRSGIIFPTFNFTEKQGYALQNGGYYWAINDYFDLMVTENISNVDYYTLDVDYKVTQPKDQVIEITSSELSYGPVDNIAIQGTVANNGEITANMVKVIATLYDRDGNVIAVSQARTEPDYLRANDESFFLIPILDKTQASEMVDYSVIAESEEYTAVPEFPLGSGVLLVASLSAYIALTKNPSVITRSLGHLSNTRWILSRLR